MARIENQGDYPVKTNPASADFLIGTDSEDSNKTVSFTIESVSGSIGATLYNSDGTITQARAVSFNSTLNFSGVTASSDLILQRSGGARVRINNTGILVGSGSGSFPGMVYEDDYSANYTNRSLVDKEYVDTNGAIPAGNNKSVQFNNAGVFGASDNIFIDGVGTSLNLVDDIELYLGTNLDALFRHNSGTSQNELISNDVGFSFKLIGTPSDFFFELTNSSVDTSFQVTDAAQSNSLFYIDGTGVAAFGTNSPDTSALLELSSTTSGFLKPRLTTVQRDAIATPATGLEIYNTTTGEPEFYNGSAWEAAVANIYTSDGTVAGVRTVTLNDDISFNSTTGDTFLVSMTSSGEIQLATSGGQFAMSDAESVFTDLSPGLQGIKYAADYSATFVARSLPDKAYTDSNSFILNNLSVSDENRTISVTDTDDSGDLFSASAFGTNFSSSVIVQSTLLRLYYEVGGVFSRITVDASEMVIEDDLNLKGLVYDADYSDNFTARSLPDKAYVDLIATLTTGIKTGGLLSPNADPTLFDISDGFGYVVDNFTDPENPVITKVTWSGQTGLTPTNIATDDLSFIAFNAAGTVVQQTTNFTPAQYRDLIVLGALVHIDNVNITSTEDFSSDAGNSYLVRDLGEAMGELNISGNNFLPASTDLTLKIEAGNTFRPQVNRDSNVKDPNFLSSSAVDPITFLYAYNDGSGGTTVVASQTDVDPDQYDDGSGTLASVPTNNFTNQWCYFFPGSNIIVVRYGETTYATLADALADVFVTRPSTIGIDLNSEFIRTVISVEEGATDLTAALDAAFTDTGKFGLI